MTKWEHVIRFTIFLIVRAAGVAANAVVGGGGGCGCGGDVVADVV